MGNQEVESQGYGVKESAYAVISFRGMDLPERYRGFVFSKWLRSLKHGNDYFKLADSQSFFEAYEPYIHAVLARPGTTLRLAVLADDHDVAIGWSAIEGDTLHYVFVQYEYRNHGIAKSLVPVPIKTITHLTKSGLAIWHKKLPEARFNPFK